MTILRNVIVLLISLLPLTTITSQNISTTTSDTLITITPIQLKEINLIFNEHHTLLKERDLLNKKIAAQEKIINNYENIDSINVERIFNCESRYNKCKIEQDALNSQLKKTKRYLNICKCIAGGSLLAAIILCLR